MRPDQTQQSDDTLWFVLIIAIGGLWLLTAALVYPAAFLASGRGPGIGFREVLSAAPRAFASAGDPASAFPEPAASRLPGAIGYWATQATAAILLILAVAWGYIWASSRGEGLDKRRRLDVEAQPRLATKRELKRERITAPTDGRFVYGHSGRHLLATHRHATGTKRRSVPGALALVGPSRSGKSLTAIVGAQLWPGPAIIASAKTDLIEPTLDARSAIGDVKVYDPSRLTPIPSDSWSPLHDAHTFVDAQRSAGRLLAAVEIDRTGSAKFWSQAGEGLVGALLWLAANTHGLTMTDVARWVMELDQPTTEDPGKAAAYLRTIATTDGVDPELIADVTSTLAGIWRSDDRLTGSFYASARQAVKPWTRDEVRRISRTTTIDLDWLTAGDNTLYLAAPLTDQQTLAPAFGALIADLVDQVILRLDRDRRPLDHELLLLIDETANMPLNQLPSWTSTVAGYGIQLVTVWQTLAQIYDAHGERGGNNVLGNHRTMVFFPGIRDPETTDYVGRIVGNEHQPGYVNGPGPGFLGVPRRETATGVPVIPPHVLRQMGDDDRLLITGSTPPAHIHAITHVRKRWHFTRRDVDS